MNNLKHIAVILDGNRRYAKIRNKKPWQGHSTGADRVEKFLKWCNEFKIHEVTLYVLSTENLKRDKREVEELFNLTRKFIKKLEKDTKIKENNVRIKFIGDLSLIPKNIKTSIEEIEEKTKNYDKYRLNLCFAYGGRQELVHAFNKLLKQNKKQINEEDITKALWLSNEPDLIIRTGGEIRSSNFLPWQSTYSEWCFLKKLWPEFTKKDLEKAINNFKKTKRNLGK